MYNNPTAKASQKEGELCIFNYPNLRKIPQRILNLSKTCEIIVTRHGKWLGRIVSEDNAAKPEKLNAFDELMNFVKTAPYVPDNTVYDEDVEECLKDRGLLCESCG